jgi:ABC-type multidrug transport system fused ATPase/permease subunit
MKVEAATRGFWSSFKVILGSATADLLLLLPALTLSWLIAQIASASLWVSSIGAAFFVYLSISAGRDAWKLWQGLTEISAPTGWSFWKGVIILRVAGLTKRYGQRTAVDGLDLDVRHGAVFGFLGPNGAGKTTAISMILGLITPDAGRVDILGHAVTEGNTAGLRRVGAIVETPAFYPYLSALDNLRVFAGARGGVPASRFAEVLALVGLTGRERERFNAFSLARCFSS